MSIRVDADACPNHAQVGYDFNTHSDFYEVYRFSRGDNFRIVQPIDLPPVTP